MSTVKMIANVVDPDGKWLYRVGGISAVVLGIAYIVIFPVYAYVGAPPSGGEAWLEYSAGKTTAWWVILGLSVLTDLLFVPVVLSLYLALKGVNRNVMLVATAFVGLFIVLDLAVTWSNYAALITLADHYVAATTEAQRAAYVAAASYASAVLTSTLEGVYSIVILALGILMIGVVMLRGIFSRTVAYMGLATGILGIVSVAGRFLANTLSVTIIIASVLTTFWLLLVGHRLYGLGQQ
jgi:hypothetical protein